MLRFLMRRLARAVMILFLVTLFAFLLLELVPGDAARVVAGELATEEQVQVIRERLGLDKPATQRYAAYLGRTLRGDLGTSVTIQPGTPVKRIFVRLAPVTLSLAALGLLLAVAVSIPVGIVSALRRDGYLDHGLTSVMALALAIPPFVVGPLLLSFFALRLRWFPTIGYTPLSQGFTDWLRHLVLPAATLAVIPAAELARQIRGSLVDAFEQSYVRTARAKGLRPRLVVGKHAAKNAAIPAVTVLGLQIQRTIGGSVVVETVFGIIGLGWLALAAVLARDFAVVQAMVLVTAGVVVVTNLLVDFTYGYFNPKLRK